MDGWVLLWKVVIFGALGLFTLLSIWVTIAGIGDIRRMFASLRAEAADTSQDDT